MKVKNVLMIAAVLLAMLAVPAMAAETGDKNMPVKYSVSQTYVISIPDAGVTLGETAVTADVGIIEAQINPGNKVNLRISSDDGVWKLTHATASDSLTYTIRNTTSGNAHVNNDVVVTTPENVKYDDSTMSSLTFALDAKQKPQFAGDYTDTLTFTGSIVSSSIEADVKAEVSDSNNAEQLLDKNAEVIELTLQEDITLDTTAWETLAHGGSDTKTITINGNGKTLTFNLKDSDWAHVVTNNNAKLVLNNVKIATDGYNSGHWKRLGVHFACPVEMNGVESTVLLGFKNDATLNDVTITTDAERYALWIHSNGQTVDIAGLTITSTAGRYIKIADEDAGTGLVTLNIKDSTFGDSADGTNKAAILVSSKYGATITNLGSVDISQVKADSSNAVWVDEDWSAYDNLVTVTDFTKKIEGA